MKQEALKAFLLDKAQYYNQVAFIENDPIKIPHQFSVLQDIEIAGFFTALISWGHRKSILKSAQQIINLMGNTPYQFILEHQEKDLKPLVNFVHRTFNATDLLYFIQRLKEHYQNHHSLEAAFIPIQNPNEFTIEQSLNHFYHYIFDSPVLVQRSRKHVAAPFKKSACKRLNMYLRWMVRQDDKGVDFGLWRQISPQQLIVPLDTHVCQIAFKLGLLKDHKSCWNNALLLSQYFKSIVPNDPCLLDFALFGLGVEARLTQGLGIK